MKLLTYLKQSTNECGTATSRLDILVQKVPSSQDAPSQIMASGKYYTIVETNCPAYTYERPSSSIGSIKINSSIQTSGPLSWLQVINDDGAKIASCITE
ncbi:unnamed protein product [Rotaria sp. Silwood2]|nr:unnamed protein product [Rotaria sp. Silwood2]CAF3108376.1 unnamed protein product [Rotaria sp. Silwood2]CAF3112338.1 unnamed protein product [Rotaria sp. Silwood2]CAF3332569.1 unnamed protein product [Rotaria sp. Silwood2]CAF4057895.1 unnamed protein product [Rotaria sp. Silwood2]